MQGNLFGGSNNLGNIRIAAARQRTVILMYKDSKGDITQREIEPYEFKNEGVYGHCYSRDAIRLFKFANILDVKVTGKTFIPRWPILIE